MNSNWYHSDGQQTFGPLPEDQIIALIQSGQLNSDHFVLPEGSEDWQPVHASPFASHLAQPSPVPEQAQQPKGVAPARQPGAAAVPVRSPRPQAASHGAANAHQGLNRNLLVLGSLTLLVLGGLGFFLTTKVGGNTYNTEQNTTNQIINNSYFTQLIASGATTEMDLNAVTDIRPYGDGFIGITKEPLPWEQAQILAKRTGAEILALGETGAGSTQKLLDWLVNSFTSVLSSTVWVGQQGDSRVLDGREILAVTSLERSRRALLQWSPGNSARSKSTTDQSAADPSSFIALFKGKDLTGFRGGNTFDPRKLEAMPEAERSAQIAKWTVSMRQHWRAENGELINDGKGDYATTEKEFGDFELVLEYKTVRGADSGICLRGYPQVQIWDSTQPDDPKKPGRSPNLGSGGLWNNSIGAPGKDPLVKADKPFGEWNKLRIMMTGDRVSVWLNDQLVVDQAVLENYFARGTPITSRGPIQFQTFKGEVRFRNIRIREIFSGEPPPTTEAEKMAEKQVTIEGSFGGIGAVLEPSSHGLRISRVTSAGPADSAGIQTGWEIASINAVSTSGMEIKDAVKLLRGPVGAEVKLEVTPPGGPRREVTLVRAKVMVSPVEGRLLESGELMLQLSRFDKETPAAVRALLNDHATAKGVILDLRGSGEGVAEMVAEVADFFLPAKSTLWFIRHTSGKVTERTSAANPLTSLPLVVLADNKTCYGGELLASALQRNKRAVVVGRSTAGSPTPMRELVKLVDGSHQMKERGVHLLSRNGDATNVLPDIILADAASEADFLRSASEALSLRKPRAP